MTMIVLVLLILALVLLDLTAQRWAIPYDIDSADWEHHR
jgi:hypothetical protein